MGGYKIKTPIAAVAGVRDADCMTVSGGKLVDGDGIKLQHATGTGEVTLTEVTLGKVKVAEADMTGKGLKYEIIKPKDKDGNATTTGTWTIKITVTDKAKATADIADAVGDGLTVTYNALGTPAQNDDVQFTTDGTGDGLELQIGDTADKFNKLKVNVGDMHAKGLGIDKVDISSQTGAAAAIQKIKDAINTVSSTRGDLGAVQNRLEHTQNNLSVMTENIQDAESTIRDTDVADEMMAYTKNNILIQSAQAMLAQANQVPQGVLQLLQ